uniref:Zinc finger, CCHC-type n=1 Tax=Tanacetum cinerariifolium TaxID=118510 RepID=A0A6L2M838_TANCI|nr:zinc finger, CCHC-type [Tanacetum cinerariifolium]
MTDSVKDMTTKFGNLDKFEGSDFRRWQEKMHFLLTTLKVVYVLSTPAPEYVENETLDQTRKRCMWDNDDYICRRHILNGMSDALFDDDEIVWWIDSAATCHACKDRCWFDTFHPVEDESVLHMGDESTKPILGRGNVIESRDAIFDENRLSSIPRPKDIISSSNGTQGGDLPGETSIEIPEPQRSNRARVAKSVQMDLQKKMKVNGTIDKFKVRLVIQGFRQKEGINYFDTYAPVARISTIRLLIALAATHNIVIHQMDVKTAFLNDKTKEFLSSNFSMKDMGEADVILEIRIKRKNKGLAITQSHYIEKILKKFNCEGCGPVSTPMEAGIKLMPHMGKPVNQLEYSRAIGYLMYAMTSTRPDIAYVVRKLSRFTSNPSNHHWEAIIIVFRYLKNTMNYGLSYVGFPSVIEGYSHASWITNSKDHTFTTGWVFLLGEGAISWASKKQTCITDSTIESEFVALAAAGKEAEWLRNLIYEISLWPKPISPIYMHCDSAATLAKAYSQIYNGKSRYLGVIHSMVRELITNGVISVDFVRSQQNLADHLTKGLARDLVHKSAIGMGLKSI